MTHMSQKEMVNQPHIQSASQGSSDMQLVFALGYWKSGSQDACMPQNGVPLGKSGFPKNTLANQKFVFWDASALVFFCVPGVKYADFCVNTHTGVNFVILAQLFELLCGQAQFCEK